MYIFNFLTTVKVGVEILDKTISVAQIAVEVIEKLYLAFPVAGFGAPDASKPIKEIIDQIRERLQKYKLISSTTLLVLTILIQILQQILNYLSLLDSVVQGCAIEGQLSQEQLSKSKTCAIRLTEYIMQHPAGPPRLGGRGPPLERGLGPTIPG